MTKQDIIDHLTNDCGLHRSSAIRAVDGVINSISDTLTRGEAVTLRGFATIKPVNVARKIGRNISAGSTIVIPAQRTVRIKISKQLKNRMNNGK